MLATAVDSGVVRQMCARHHRQLASRWSIDDITGTVTTMLVGYALTNSERPGHLEVARFADGTSSASGWVGKVIGAMRASRILRGMHEDATTRVDLLGDTDPASASSAEATALDEHTVDVEDQTRGLPATSATIRLVHASALHQLLGLPPLRSWRLTSAHRIELTHRLNEDPTLARRSLTANRNVAGADEALTSLWSGWSRDDLAAMLEKSTPTRDIPHLLCLAARAPCRAPRAATEISPAPAVGCSMPPHHPPRARPPRPSTPSSTPRSRPTPTSTASAAHCPRQTSMRAPLPPSASPPD
ncbi:hypothetical protein [Brachybacterium sp. GPGPB12]|uniref:hypothetical protein n=1 Tax=Brachybacterium sp. GPGPB12 TaxID=3023517 RepID=UPI003134289E